MLNENIKNIRKSFGISQIELANAIGVSKQCVSNWENDNIQPSVEMLVKLSSYFRVSADYLLGLDNDDRLDVTGLTAKEKAHLALIVKDLLKNRS